MSKMSKDFKTKSALRCADGGLLTFGKKVDAAEAAAVRTPAPPAPVLAPVRETVQGGMVSDGVVSRPVAPPVKKEEPQGVISKLRKFVGLADGGSPWDSSYRAGGALGQRAVMPAVMPVMARPTAGPVANPATPSPELAPASPVATPAAPTHSIATANVSFGNGSLGVAGDGQDWAGTAMKTSKLGYTTGLRGGGRVAGPGGPREDKVGPVMMSDGEYVLPAKTVQKLGGPEELDELVQATNDGRKPHGVEERGEKHSLRGFAGGGTFYADEFGNVSQEPWKRAVPARVPPVNAGVPAVAPQPYVGPEIDVTPRGQPAMKDITGEAQRMARDPIDVKAVRSTTPGNSVLRQPKTAGWFAAPAATFAAGEKMIDDTAHPEMRARYEQRMGVESPVGSAASDSANILERVGNAVTMGMAGRVGRGIAEKIGGGSFGTGFMSQDPNSLPVDAKPVVKPAVAPAPEEPATTPVMPMAREGVDTEGAIRRTGNTFYGGVTGERGKQLENQEAERGRAQYARDAAGMYAAIQGHIAAGDLETANKLAWDSQSRALVNQGYGARNAAMAANQRGPSAEETDINSRYDKQHDRLRKIFSSDRAQGNLAKHIDALEGRRAGELAALRNTNATMRGQDIAAGEASKRTAAEAAANESRNALARENAARTQANSDREYKLNVSKYGTDVAKMMHEQQSARETKNEAAISNFVKEQSGNGGKLDPKYAAEFSTFVNGSVGDLHALPPSERGPALAGALTKFNIMKKSNDTRGAIGSKATTQFRDAGTPRESNVSDVVHGLSGKSYIGSKLPWGDSSVVDIPGVGVRSAADLGAEDDADISDYIHRGLRNRGK